MSIRSEVETVELRQRIESLEATMKVLREQVVEVERLIGAMSRQSAQRGKAA